jgi:hypothetical protein
VSLCTDLAEVRYCEELSYEQAEAVFWILVADPELEWVSCEGDEASRVVTYYRVVSSLMPLVIASPLDPDPEEETILEALPKWLSLSGPLHLGEVIEEHFALWLSRRGGCMLEIAYRYRREQPMVEPEQRAC